VKPGLVRELGRDGVELASDDVHLVRSRASSKSAFPYERATPGEAFT